MIQIDRNTAILAGSGLLAGLAGSLAMLASQKAEMRLTERKSSTIPAKAVETIAGLRVEGESDERRLSTAAHFAFGTGLGLGLAALAKTPEPARGIAFFLGAWSAGTALIMGLGLSKPPTKWRPSQLAIDLGHHAVYAGGAALTFSGLRRLVRV